MIIITNNRAGVTYLTALVVTKQKKVLVKGEAPVEVEVSAPVAKPILGSTLIDDPSWEKAILEDEDFKRWTTEETLKSGHHLSPEGDYRTLFTLQTFDKKEEDKEAGSSPYRPVPGKKFVKIIEKITDLATLADILEKDPRPEVRAAADKRITVIKTPTARTAAQ